MNAKEELTKLLMESYDRGVKDATEAGLAALEKAVLAALEKAVLAEREACAKLCDDRVTAYRYATDAWAQEHIDEAKHLAAAIRARGQA